MNVCVTLCSAIKKETLPSENELNHTPNAIWYGIILYFCFNGNYLLGFSSENRIFIGYVQIIWRLADINTLRKKSYMKKYVYHTPIQVSTKQLESENNFHKPFFVFIDVFN